MSREFRDKRTIVTRSVSEDKWAVRPRVRFLKCAFFVQSAAPPAPCRWIQVWELHADPTRPAVSSLAARPPPTAAAGRRGWKRRAWERTSLSNQT